MFTYCEKRQMLGDQRVTPGFQDINFIRKMLPFRPLSPWPESTEQCLIVSTEPYARVKKESQVRRRVLYKRSRAVNAAGIAYLLIHYNFHVFLNLLFQICDLVFRERVY